ncbi:recombinase family protein [Kitasatospora sp. NPDC001660]
MTIPQLPPTESMVLALGYSRISEDQLDQRRGVKRQQADLRAHCASEGWHLHAEFCDNDLSALDGGDRPDYDRLMAAAIELGTQAKAAGKRVVVLAYHSSRLWRNRVERAQAIEDLRRAGVFVAFESGGYYDLSKASQRSALAQAGENDTTESEVKSERVQRAALERAQEGRANGAVAYGWRRQYEYDNRGRIVGFHDEEHPEQAAVVRDIVTRLLAGESLMSITTDLNERGVPAPGAGQNRKHRTLGQDEEGRRWNKTSTKKIALRPANAAIRTHLGSEYPAAWPELITAEQHAQIKELFADRAVSRERPGARVHLLSWGEIAICGVCEGHLRVALKGNAKRGTKRPTYVCASNQGCVGRNETALDDYVGKAVVKILSSAGAADIFKQDDTAALAALERAEGLRARQAVAADDFAAGLITRDQLVRITESLTKQIAEARAEARRLRPAFDLTVFDGLVGPQAAERWQALDVTRRRRVLEGLGLRLKVFPAQRRGPGFDHTTVEMRWGALAG